MRKRNIRIQVRLNDIEYEKLLDDIAKSNENISNYIRKLIVGKEIKEKPDYRFYEVMKQLSKIGVNLNQIAHKANSINNIDKDYYNQEAKNWQELSREIKSKFL
ncbi:MAG: plasmid mobilization relaxosome protein MobC [Clostridia bacterium]|nr:plasmid mobilization relaxosome protein MobC [Clostridia bacterium]